MKKLIIFLVGMMLLGLFGCYRHEGSDIVPYILYQTEECNKTIRVDYYGNEKNDGLLIFYFTDLYSDENFIKSYSELLLLIKDKKEWKFKQLDYDFFSEHKSKYMNEEFIKMIQRLNINILNCKTDSIEYSNKGFSFQIEK